MFEKRHFEKIAQFVRNSELDEKETLAQQLVKLFSADNERFKAGKFLKACGLTMENQNIHIENLKTSCFSVPVPAYLKF